MTAARRAGVPVAEIYDYGPGALGQAYLLMERLEGETIPRRLLRDEAYAAVRPGLARRLGEILARIHQVDPDEVPDLPHLDALGQLTGLYQAFAEPRPALGDRPALAGRAPARSRGGHPGARRFPDRQPHGRRRTACAGCSTGSSLHRGDPMRGPGLAMHQGLAVRLGEPGRRFRRPRRPDGGLRRRRRHPAGRGAPSAGGSCTAPCGGRCCAAVRPPLPRGGEPSIELARARPPRLRAGVRHPARAGPAAPLTVTIRWRTGRPASPHDQPKAPACSAPSASSSTTGRPGPIRRLAFHARVAANALRIAEREAMLAPGRRTRPPGRLAALAAPTMPRSARRSETVAAITASASHRGGPHLPYRSSLGH